MYTCTKCACCAANIQNNPNHICSSTLHTSPKSEWVQRDHRTQNKCCGDASARSPAKNKPRALLCLFPVLLGRCKCAVSHKEQIASTISPFPSTASDINPTFPSRLTECPPPGTHSWENCNCAKCVGHFQAKWRRFITDQEPTPSPPSLKGIIPVKSLTLEKKKSKKEIETLFPAQKQLHYHGSPAQTYSHLLSWGERFQRGSGCPTCPWSS